MKEKTINRCWGKVWKECVHAFDGFFDNEEARRNIVILLCQAESEDDVINLLESHKE